MASDIAYRFALATLIDAVEYWYNGDIENKVNKTMVENAIISGKKLLDEDLPEVFQRKISQKDILPEKIEAI